jgi:hypothetical protein
MPQISAFYGIVISMYVGREHPPPHFHAIYAEFEAQVALDGTILNGSLPPRAASLVKEWAELHGTELSDN